MTVKYKDYYEILGVSRDASTEEIHKKYRKLARKYHPDVNKSQGSEARFKEIGEAYEVLKDEKKRKLYDRLGSNWKAGQDFKPPPDWNGGGFRFEGVDDLGDPGGFSEFFQSIFGGLGGFDGFRNGHAKFEGNGPYEGASFRTGFRQKGRDQEVEIEIPLEDAFHGASRSLILDEPGHGQKRYDVKIPRGVTHGARIRLAGQGESGHGGAVSGDLYLRVNIAPHPRFRLEGRNLSTHVDLAPWDAALGAEVEVSTLSGVVKVKIPAGTSSGKTLRLRGKGLPGRSGKSGDLLLTIRIAVPAKVSDRERELYEKLARCSRFNPRSKRT